MKRDRPDELSQEQPQKEGLDSQKTQQTALTNSDIYALLEPHGSRVTFITPNTSEPMFDEGGYSHLTFYTGSPDPRPYRPVTVEIFIGGNHVNGKYVERKSIGKLNVSMTRSTPSYMVDPHHNQHGTMCVFRVLRTAKNEAKIIGKWQISAESALKKLSTDRLATAKPPVSAGQLHDVARFALSGVSAENTVVPTVGGSSSAGRLTPINTNLPFEQSTTVTPVAVMLTDDQIIGLLRDPIHGHHFRSAISSMAAELLAQLQTELMRLRGMM